MEEEIQGSQGQRILFTAGPSWAGKSSFINTLAKQQLTAVGAGNGSSTTVQIAPFNVVVGTSSGPETMMIYDVPGFNDSRPQNTNAELREKLMHSILEKTESEHLSAILLFESLVAEPVQIERTLTNMQMILGPNFKQSTIVIFTKLDKIECEDEAISRKTYVEGLCKDRGIQFMYWKNNFRDRIIDNETYENQVNELLHKMTLIVPYHLKEITKNKKKIMDLAEKLQAESPPVASRTTLQLEVPVVIEYSEAVEKKRQKIVQTGEGPKINPFFSGLGSGVFGGIGGLIGGVADFLVGRKNKGYKVIEESYVEYEKRYRIEKKIEEKEVETGTKLPLDYFIPKAKEEILRQIRQGR